MERLIPTLTPLYNAGFGVLGQPNFTSSAVNTTQNGMYAPDGVAFDASGNLYVVESNNNRVTMFVPPFSNGMNAGSTTVSTHNLVVYLDNKTPIFYTPKQGIS